MMIELDALTGQVLLKSGELNKDIQTNDIELTPDGGAVLAGHHYSLA